MPDGVHCIVVGKLGWLTNLVAVIGGNCSVTVLDAQGTEVFWTVTGDVVKSLAILDFDGDGENEVSLPIVRIKLVMFENWILWDFLD